MREIHASAVTATCRACSNAVSVGEPCFSEVIGGSPPLHRAYHLTCAAAARPIELAPVLAAYRGTLPGRATLERLVAGHSLWLDAAADPDNDEPRSVLADFLQTEGNPRGELIALQLAGASARAEEMLQKHGQAWLGDLRTIARGARFQRGFVTRLELNEVGDDVAQTSVDRDALATFGTIEDLIPTRSRPRTYAWLLGGEGMRALRRVEIWDHKTLTAFAGTHAPLVHVACGLPHVDATFLEACKLLPRLTSISIAAAWWERIIKSPFSGRLTSLSLVGKAPRLSEVRAIWSHLPRALTVAVTPEAHLDRCVGSPSEWLELAPSEEGLIARASETWATLELVEQLAAWPTRVCRLELETPSNTVIVRLRQAAKRQRLELVFTERPPRLGYVRGGPPRAEPGLRG